MTFLLVRVSLIKVLCPDCHSKQNTREGHNCPEHNWAWTQWSGLGPAELASRNCAARARTAMQHLRRGNG